MKTQLMIRSILVSAVLLIGQQVLATQINIDYAAGLERYLPSINANERARESAFRQNRLPNNQGRFNTLFTFNKERLHGTDWAGERLIESIDNYTVDSLLRSLVEDNIERFTSAEEISRIDLDVRRIRVENYSLPRIGAAGTYVKGSVSWYNDDGQLGGQTDLTANLINIPALDKPYTGEKYAFGEPDKENRVGPVLSYFVQQALQDLFPNESQQIHGPVFIQFANSVSNGP